jgi:hypothetical protein
MILAGIVFVDKTKNTAVLGFRSPFLFANEANPTHAFFKALPA